MHYATLRPDENPETRLSSGSPPEGGRHERGRHRRDQEQHAGRGRHQHLRDKLQQFLAFASLIAIFVFFSIASPNFLTTTTSRRSSSRPS